MATSVVLRVTKVIPITFAVAAISPSTTGTRLGTLMRPHSSATPAVIGTMRSA